MSSAREAKGNWIDQNIRFDTKCNFTNTVIDQRVLQELGKKLQKEAVRISR